MSEPDHSRDADRPPFDVRTLRVRWGGERSRTTAIPQLKGMDVTCLS